MEIGGADEDDNGNDENLKPETSDDNRSEEDSDENKSDKTAKEADSRNLREPYGKNRLTRKTLEANRAVTGSAMTE